MLQKRRLKSETRIRRGPSACLSLTQPSEARLHSLLARVRSSALLPSYLVGRSQGVGQVPLVGLRALASPESSLQIGNSVASAGREVPRTTRSAQRQLSCARASESRWPHTPVHRVCGVEYRSAQLSSLYLPLATSSEYARTQIRAD